MSHVINDLNQFRFRRRDDQELFTGDFISKIIVPHPALNFAKNVTITYQVSKMNLGRLSVGVEIKTFSVSGLSRLVDSWFICLEY